MPRHNRRSRQSASLFDPGARWHASEHTGRCARDRPGSARMIRDVEALPANVELAIIGAGPAGLAAATTAARLRVGVLVLDENPNAGGQIYRAITVNPIKDHALLGSDYWRGETLVREALTSSALHAAGAVVWSVSPVDGGGYAIGVSMAGRSRIITARGGTLPSGAPQRPFPNPRWAPPAGVSCGGAPNPLEDSGLVRR